MLDKLQSMRHNLQFTSFLCTLHLALPSASCSSALTVRGREQLYLCYEGYHCFAFFQDFEVDCRAVLRAGRESCGFISRGPDSLILRLSHSKNSHNDRSSYRTQQHSC